MVEGRSIAEWWHTAALIATLANQNRDPKKRRQPYEAEEFHPHYGKKKRRGGIPITKDTIGLLKIYLNKR